MAEPLSPNALTQTPANPSAERLANTNAAAFCHWLRAVHGVQITPGDSAGKALRTAPSAALRAWAEADPATAANLIRRFASTNGESARITAGLLLQADLRPDDRILIDIHGLAPEWLPQALAATRGRAAQAEAATVLIADRLPEILPPKIQRIILTERAFPSETPRPEITLSHAVDWTWPAAPSRPQLPEGIER